MGKNKWLSLQNVFGFTLGMTLASLIGSVLIARAATTPTASVNLNQNSAINFITHSHGCEKMFSSPGGTLNVFGNGIKNTNTSTALQLACALSSPGDGFDPLTDYAGIDVLDQNNEAVGGSVIIKSCFTTRAIAGTGCSEAVSTQSASTGFYGIQVPFPSAPVDVTAARYLDITLPPQDVNSASVVRAYGYYDASFSVGGGGGDLAALQTQIDGINNTLADHSKKFDGTQPSNLLTSLNALSTTVSSHTEQFNGTQSSGLQTSVNGLSSTVATHTEQFNGTQSSGLQTSVNGVSSTVSSHTSQITSLNAGLSSHSSSISQLNGKVSGLENTVFKRVFITSSTHSGNLGGLSGADNICQTRATSASLGGTWKAWLSSDSGTAANRIAKHSSVYRLVNGAVVAFDYQDLLDNQIQSPINRDETGAVQNGQTWTASSGNGQLQSPHCNNWTDPTAGQQGLTGDATSTNAPWTNLMTMGCNSLLRLYCFEQ